MPPMNFNAGQQAQQQAALGQQQALRAQQQAQQQAIVAQQQAQQQALRVQQQQAQQQAIAAQQQMRERQRVADERAMESAGANGHGPRASTDADTGASGRDPRLVLATAREALEKEEWTQSASAFALLLSTPGYAAEARYGLGWIELQRGAPDRAAALFREATDCDPRHANAWFALGRVTEENSVDDAIDCYRRALAANPGHYGATQRLRLLVEPSVAPGISDLDGSLSTSDGHPAGPTVPPTSYGSGALADPGGLGVVEYLQRDNSAVARDALARIESLTRSSRFRFSAYLQRIVTRFVLLVFPAAALAYILYHITPLTVGGTTIHFYTSNSTELIVAALAIWALWTTWTLLDCATNTVTIRNARIRWTHGVLNKHTETLDVWTARDVEFDRDLVQRLTGDGTLTFKGTTHDRPRRFHKGHFKPLSLTGIARADELEDIYALLLDLKFLLRAHPGLKGIIQ